jgi:hypothetical protein
MQWIKNKLVYFLWMIPAGLGWLWLAYKAYHEIRVVRIESGSLKYELVFLAILALASLIYAWLMLRILDFPWLRPLERSQSRFGWPGYWTGVVALVICVTYFISYTEYGTVSQRPLIRLVLFLGSVFLSACLLPHQPGEPIPWPAYIGSIALFGSLLSFGWALQEAKNYPFQLYWSEGNRFWDYSLLYGRRLYIYPPDQPLYALIDRGRQSLWGLPFLFTNPTIQQVRLWSILVFTVPYMLLGWFVFRPVKGQLPAWLLLGLWSFLFLDQGPIYTPLVLSVVLVMGGRRLPFWVNIILVFIAGYYAQVSRYTWMFAPAMYAGIAAFVSSACGNTRSSRRRWLEAVALAGSGLLGGFAFPRMLPWLVKIINSLSGGEPAVVNPGITNLVTRQPLLWDRLLPNPTYPLGILPALLLAAGPLLAIVLYWFWRKSSPYDLWQKLAVSGVLAVFFAVGLVASVKIGGGNNLHNMDMFLIALVVLAGLAWETGASSWLKLDGHRPVWVLACMAFLVLYPTYQVMQEITPRQVPGQKTVDEALGSLRLKVTEAQKCGDVLFIDNRQLLTFGNLTGIRLVPEYEKKLMMDKAMADESAYFTAFYKDLEASRFAMIISEPLHTGYQGSVFQFGNENDAWVKWVSRPVLKYYSQYETIEDVGIQMLVPRNQTCEFLP